MAKEIKKVVLYARVSSKEQEREGFSIPAQFELLRNYANTHNMIILKEFEDVETAKCQGRTHFTEMLKFLKTSKSCKNIASSISGSGAFFIISFICSSERFTIT